MKDGCFEAVGKSLADAVRRNVSPHTLHDPAERQHPLQTTCLDTEELSSRPRPRPREQPDLHQGDAHDAAQKLRTLNLNPPRPGFVVFTSLTIIYMLVAGGLPSSLTHILR